MDNWIIPCNCNYYDVVSAFENLDKINWKQSTNIKAGDIIYIYAGKPYSAILFKTIATAVNQGERTIKDFEYVIDGTNYIDYGRYMELQLIQRYEKSAITFSELRENGLRSIQGPIKVKPELQDFIDNISAL